MGGNPRQALSRNDFGRRITIESRHQVSAMTADTDSSIRSRTALPRRLHTGLPLAVRRLAGGAR